MGFRYKDLSLNTSLYLRVGGKTFLQSAYQSTYLPSEFENLTNELVNRWTPENTNSSLPGLPDINVKSQQLPNGEYATVYQMYNYSTDYHVARLQQPGTELQRALQMGETPPAPPKPVYRRIGDQPLHNTHRRLQGT